MYTNQCKYQLPRLEGISSLILLLLNNIIKIIIMEHLFSKERLQYFKIRFQMLTIKKLEEIY